MKDINAVTEGEIHRVCAKAVDIDEHSAIMIPVSFCVRLHLCANSDLAFSLPQSRLCILWARQLPPQREPRALPRRAQVCLCGTTPLKCAATGGKHSFFMHPKGALHVPKARFMCRRHASYAEGVLHFPLYFPIASSIFPFIIRVRASAVLSKTGERVFISSSEYRLKTQSAKSQPSGF